MGPIALFLRAVDPARNVFRSYAIAVDQDLFGFWCVSLHWGRLGRPGSGAKHAFEQIGPALAFARLQLRRRLRSKKRIGVPYELTQAQGGVAAEVFLAMATAGRA